MHIYLIYAKMLTCKFYKHFQVNVDVINIVLRALNSIINSLFFTPDTLEVIVFSKMYNQYVFQVFPFYCNWSNRSPID